MFINESDFQSDRPENLNKLVEEGKARLLDAGTPVKVRKEGGGHKTVYTIDLSGKYYYIQKDALSCHRVPDTPSISADLVRQEQ